MGLRRFLFDTTAPQMLYTNLCSLCRLQRQRREPERKRGMILDLHIHTSWNSADSNLSPIELIREAKAPGARRRGGHRARSWLGPFPGA